MRRRIQYGKLDSVSDLFDLKGFSGIFNSGFRLISRWKMQGPLSTSIVPMQQNGRRPSTAPNGLAPFRRARTRAAIHNINPQVSYLRSNFTILGENLYYYNFLCSFCLRRLVNDVYTSAHVDSSFSVLFD